MQNCTDYSPSAAESVGDGEVNSILLFGVRVKIDPMRKSVSMNNLSEYEPPNPNNTTNNSNKNAANDLLKDGGYASADDVVPQPSTNATRERKRGVPWTEQEHKMFLIGLQKVGKGDWRGISRTYVKTRTPTQVASHAQKYFLRLTNNNRRRRRSSLFDMTTASVTAMPMEEGRNNQENPAQQVPPPTTQPQSIAPNVNGFSVVPFPVTFSPVMMSMQGGNIMESSALAHSDHMMTNSSSLLAAPPVPHPMPMDLNFNQQVLSLNLSLSSGNDQSSPARNSSFQMMPSLKNGDGILTSPA